MEGVRNGEKGRGSTARGMEERNNCALVCFLLWFASFAFERNASCFGTTTLLFGGNYCFGTTRLEGVDFLLLLLLCHFSLTGFAGRETSLNDT